MNAQDVGEQFAYLREVNCLSYGEIAEKTGLSKSYLYDIAHGRTMPSIDTVHKLSVCFGMSVAQFLGESEKELTTDEQRLLAAWRAHDTKTLLQMVVEHMPDSTSVCIRGAQGNDLLDST